MQELLQPHAYGVQKIPTQLSFISLNVDSEGVRKSPLFTIAPNGLLQLDFSFQEILDITIKSITRIGNVNVISARFYFPALWMNTKSITRSCVTHTEAYKVFYILSIVFFFHYVSNVWKTHHHNRKSHHMLSILLSLGKWTFSREWEVRLCVNPIVKVRYYTSAMLPFRSDDFFFWVEVCISLYVAAFSTREMP